MSEVGEPRVRMSCKDDEFSVKYRDTPSLVECIRRGRTIAREWTVKASCGSVIKHTQKLLPGMCFNCRFLLPLFPLFLIASAFCSSRWGSQG